MPDNKRIHGPYTQKELIKLLPAGNLTRYNINNESEVLASQWTALLTDKGGFLNATSYLKENEENPDLTELIKFVRSERLGNVLRIWNRFLLVEQYSQVSLINIDLFAPSVHKAWEVEDGTITLQLQEDKIIVDADGTVRY